MTLQKGHRVAESQDTWKHGTVVQIDDEQVTVNFDTQGIRICQANELEKLLVDVGHCHGCNKLSRLNLIHKPNSPLWECLHCHYLNANFHVAKEVGNFLQCADCHCTITDKAKG